MANVVEQDDFNELERDVRSIEEDLNDIDEEFEKRVSRRVAEIFRQIAFDYGQKHGMGHHKRLFLCVADDLEKNNV